MTTSTTTEKLSMAVIAYITFIGLIIAFVDNQDKKDPSVQFHIRQSLGIGITSIALSIVGVIPFIGWAISILGFVFVVYLWVTGLINAINKKEKVVPVLGEKYNEWFKNI